MSKRTKHLKLTADHAVRIALGAYYVAASVPHGDGANLVGAWLLELSRKLKEDDITSRDYVTIIERWALEDNASAGLSVNGLHGGDNRPDNAARSGVDNG